MRQPAAGSRDARSHGPPRRAHGPPPANDRQIAQIFRSMRAATHLTREGIARRLATSAATIDDLEMGAVAALPHWPETVRIVRAYCGLLRLDPEPLLWRLQQLLRTAGPGEEPLARPQRTAQPPAVRPDSSRKMRRRGRVLRRLLALGAPPVLVAGTVLWASIAPGAFYRAVGLLPAGLEAPARAGLDTFVLYSAPRRDGLRWIDVGDPRLRKGDKLPTTRR